MRNPFTFMYPPALVEWFSVLADNMDTASSCVGNDVLSILRLLKSNERQREGYAQEIAFKAGAVGDGSPARSVRLVLSYDGFSVGEMTCAEETVAAFDWRDVECGIRRTYVENADHRREEVGERRGTCDLVSCLAGLDLGVLAASVCEVRELCEYKVVRSDGELRQKLLECLLGKAGPCRLRTRDGTVDIRLVASPGRQEGSRGSRGDGDERADRRWADCFLPSRRGCTTRGFGSARMDRSFLKAEAAKGDYMSDDLEERVRAFPSFAGYSSSSDFAAENVL